MPQLIGLVLVGGAVWLACRAVSKQMKKVGEELRRAEQKAKPVPLKRDDDGVFRPDQE